MHQRLALLSFCSGGWVSNQNRRTGKIKEEGRFSIEKEELKGQYAVSCHGSMSEQHVWHLPVSSRAFEGARKGPLEFFALFYLRNRVREKGLQQD